MLLKDIGHLANKVFELAVSYGLVNGWVVSLPYNCRSIGRPSGMAIDTVVGNI